MSRPGECEHGASTTILIKEASSFIKTCLPEQTNRILKELGFDI